VLLPGSEYYWNSSLIPANSGMTINADEIHFRHVKYRGKPMQRRELLLSAAAGIASVSSRVLAQTTASGDKLIAWSDPPPLVPESLQNVIKGITRWEDLGSWITPNDKWFSIAHYERPQVDPKTWRLEISGLVVKQTTLTLDQLKALPRKEITSTIECSGSNGLPFAQSMIGNATWAGTSLAEALRATGIKDGGIEVVFYGIDKGEETVRPGTPLEYKYTANFARSMPIAEAMNPANLLCYEMNGSPLPAANGYPVRLIAPGWYGVANVKWLTRIDVLDKRYLGRFMGRDYVTIREEQRNGQTIMAETTVGHMLLKSAPGRIAQRDGRYQINGMAWGPAVAAVEVKIDNGPWIRATLDASKSEYTWRFWHLDAPLTPGEHTVTSRAIDTAGKIQPPMDDPIIANKKTYWESNGQITRHVRIT
jgi:DMSO/TMAO reductase YedYZ molybdopterin-dependent catalytic subunit